MTELAITDLHKSFGTNAVLTGVDLTVPTGSLTAILGPSGSGKTTLLRLIAGFERIDRGTITLGGTVVDAPGSAWVASERRRIGYVPQEGSLFPHLTVRKNIGFGLPRGARDGGRVDELLELIGMAGLGGRYPHQLSGGQQQRVALVRALATRPDLVLLDEPFSALDPSLRAGVRADVRRLLRAAGATALLVTHDQDEALSLADRVAVIRYGRVCQCDTPQGLYDDPTDTEVAGFVGEANLVPGVLVNGSVRTAFGELPCHCRAAARNGASDAVVLIRPEQVKLCPAGQAGLCGRVLEREYHGHDSVIRVQSEEETGASVILARISGQVPYAVGCPVAVTVEGPVVAWCVEPDGSQVRRAP
ncbi:MAG TPA: ABC transporter ATP-binding protein [Solirubrobacteraceae bacterium]|jgi:iron(III) transport system ATP-binding protein|nr:ABC transporter ATP-binding protein [Solirubrobacteraceae bacterium]